MIIIWIPYISASAGRCTAYSTYGNQTKNTRKPHYSRLYKCFFHLKVSKIV